MISALLAYHVRKGTEGAAYGLDNSINAAGRAIAPLLGGAIATWMGVPFTFAATGMIFIFLVIVTLWFFPSRTAINPPEALR